MVRFPITVALITLLLSAAAKADIAYIPWRNPVVNGGWIISAGPDGFQFQIGCDGPTVYVPWRSGDDTANFSRSTKCSGTGGLHLTAGVETGGDYCEYDWKRGRFFDIGLHKQPEGDNWIVATEIRFQPSHIEAFDGYTKQWKTVPWEDIGYMQETHIACFE